MLSTAPQHSLIIIILVIIIVVVIIYRIPVYILNDNKRLGIGDIGLILRLELRTVIIIIKGVQG